MNFQDLISPAWTEAIGYAIIHTLWIGCAFGLIAFLALRFLRKSKPQVKYLIAAFSLLGIFATFVIAIMIFWPETQELAQNGFSANTQMDVVAPQPNTSVQQANGPIGLNQLEAIFPYLVFLWLLGAGLLFLRTFIGWIWVIRIKKHYTFGMPLYWEQMLETWKQKTGISQKVKLVESKLATVPMTIGHFRPFVILPAGTTTNLTVDELKMVVLHELAHIKRYDYLINAFQSIIESILFFHPVVWWLSHEVKKEREHISDDLAVEWGGSPQRLALALTKISESNCKSPQLALALASKKPHLLNRVKRLLTKQEISSQSPEKLTIMIIVILLTALLSTSAANYAGTQKQAEEASSLLTEFKVPDPEPFTVIQPVVNEQDPPNGKIKVVREFENGPYDKARLVMKDGEIQKLKIDGKRIDEEDYEYYHDLISKLVPEYGQDHNPFFLHPGEQVMWNGNFNVHVPAVPHFDQEVKVYHKGLMKPPHPPKPPKLFHVAPNANFNQMHGQNFNYRFFGPDSTDKDTVVIRYDSAGVQKEMTFTVPHLNFDFDFDFDVEEIEKYAEHWEEEMEKWEEGNGERMEAYQEMMEKYQEHMQEFQERMEEWQEQYEVEIERKMEKHEEEIEKDMEINNERFDKMGEKLEAMGLIEDSDDYSISLSKGTLKVNGEEQDQQAYDEFVKWYEKEFDTKVSEDMNLHLNMNKK